MDARRVLEQARRAVADARDLQGRLVELSRRLPTVEEQAAYTIEAALSGLRASAVIVSRVVGEPGNEELEVHGSAHVPGRVVRELWRVPLASALPHAEAVRTERIVACTTADELRERFPDAADLFATLRAQAVYAVPVHDLGRVQGAIALFFESPRQLSRSDVAQLRTLGLRYARALHNARLYFAEREARAEAEGARREAEAARIALSNAHAALEERIIARTAELARANARLAAEIEQREQAESERDAVRRQLANAEEAERRRLARELHDQLGQHLTAFTLNLVETRRLLGVGEPADARLAQLEVLAEAMTRDARVLALELRPPELDDLGLESALATYVAQWRTRYGVVAELVVSGAAASRSVPPEVATAIYRIVQEALTNVARHAAARQVSVVIDKPDGELRLVVEDDGAGFEADATAERVRRERRFGLASMRERAALVGGTMQVESSPGAGTTIYVRVPIDHE